MAATANDLTRQQLDELDTLLQRMLSGPATRAEPATVATAVPEPPDGWRMDSAASRRLGEARITDLPPVSRSLPPLDLPKMGPPPSTFHPTPLATFERTPPKPFVPVDDVKTSDFEIPESFGILELSTLPLAEAPAPERPATVAPVVWPLHAINWLLESGLKLFGPPGTMLTGRSGKNVLAALGIMMMAGAGLWTAQGQGWIRLPIERIVNR